ncbi:MULTISPECIES: polyprenol monophosphomannose synthase [unclassified Ekhidna]|jgi:dolichol-phosphate mannosyltransferase|uniref:polyprenol monophosphomannose synthase n=1 Tax=unclassified Ekhidna TaxID=2632188 RepID=UPI0032DFF840
MSKNLVVIPTYNECENIRDIINVTRILSPLFDILVVDDGSPDGTAKIVKEEMEKTPDRVYLIEREGKLGLGTAYITGFKWALEQGYDYICEMDADFSHDPNDLVRLHAACVDGADVAIGSRYVTGVNVVNWPMGRVLMSYFASFYVRIITGMPFRDSTAGFKCYSRRVFDKLDLNKIHFIGYAFQIEMKFNAWKHGFKIVEVPIIFTDRTKGTSKMSKGIFKEAVFGVLQMKIKSLFKKYEPVY